ncbi:MAG: TIGR02301 family protein [Rhizobiaceae bacterium]
MRKPRAKSDLLFVLAIVLSTGTGPVTSHAQGVSVVEPNAVVEEAQPGSKIKTLPPAYDSQMMRLAEILGALHYLRDLCGAEENQLWRDEMQEMLAKENPSRERRLKLTSRFNRGFRSYQEIYRECTPSAAEAANRYLRQGTRIAADIPGRYGN